jgi:hypothetical protein
VGTQVRPLCKDRQRHHSLFPYFDGHSHNWSSCLYHAQVHGRGYFLRQLFKWTSLAVTLRLSTTTQIRCLLEPLTWLRPPSGCITNKRSKTCSLEININRCVQKTWIFSLFGSRYWNRNVNLLCDDHNSGAIDRRDFFTNSSQKTLSDYLFFSCRMRSYWRMDSCSILSIIHWKLMGSYEITDSFRVSQFSGLCICFNRFNWVLKPCSHSSTYVNSDYGFYCLDLSQLRCRSNWCLARLHIQTDRSAGSTKSNPSWSPWKNASQNITLDNYSTWCINLLFKHFFWALLPGKKCLAPTILCNVRFPSREHPTSIPGLILSEYPSNLQLDKQQALHLAVAQFPDWSLCFRIRVFDMPFFLRDGRPILRRISPYFDLRDVRFSSECNYWTNDSDVHVCFFFQVPCENLQRHRQLWMNKYII